MQTFISVLALLAVVACAVNPHAAAVGSVARDPAKMASTDANKPAGRMLVEEKALPVSKQLWNVGFQGQDSIGVITHIASHDIVVGGATGMLLGINATSGTKLFTSNVDGMCNLLFHFHNGGATLIGCLAEQSYTVFDLSGNRVHFSSWKGKVRYTISQIQNTPGWHHVTANNTFVLLEQHDATNTTAILRMSGNTAEVTRVGTYESRIQGAQFIDGGARVLLWNSHTYSDGNDCINATLVDTHSAQSVYRLQNVSGPAPPPGKYCPMTQIRASPSGRVFVAADGGSIGHLYNASTGALQKIFNTHSGHNNGYYTFLLFPYPGCESLDICTMFGTKTVGIYDFDADVVAYSYYFPEESGQTLVDYDDNSFTMGGMLTNNITKNDAHSGLQIYRTWIPFGEMGLMATAVPTGDYIFYLRPPYFFGMAKATGKWVAYYGQWQGNFYIAEASKDGERAVFVGGSQFMAKLAFS